MRRRARPARAAPHACRPRRSDRSRQRLGHAGAAQHDLHQRRRRRRDPSSSGAPTTGCGSSSPTSSPTSCIWIDPRLGAGRSRRSSDGRRSRSRTCSCRLADRRARDLRRKRAHRARGGCTPATSARSSGEAARERPLEPLDRVNGGLTDWPDGLAAYAYGLGFHEYLADRFGAESLGSSPTETARRLPFTARARFDGSSASRSDAVARLPALELVATDAAASAGTSTSAAPSRLTHARLRRRRRRVRTALRRLSRGDRLLRARIRTGFPELRGVHCRRIGRVAAADHAVPRRSTAVRRDRSIVFDQQELRRNAALYSDLLRASTGAPARRHGAHARTTAARSGSVARRRDDRRRAEQRRPARPRAVRLVRGSSRTSNGASSCRPDRDGRCIAEPDTQFNAPRWSPDGRTIAVERQRLGALPEIVLVDVATKPRRVASDSGARDRHADLAARRPTRSSRPRTRRRAVQPVRVPRCGRRRWPAADAHDRRRDVAGRSPDGGTIVFVGLHRRRLRPVHDPLSTTRSGVRRRRPRARLSVAAAAPCAGIRRRDERPATAPLATLLPTSWYAV